MTFLENETVQEKFFSVQSFGFAQQVKLKMFIYLKFSKS